MLPIHLKNRRFTYLGLFISYFSIVGIGAALKLIHGGPLDDRWTVVREVTTLLTVFVLIWIIRQKECLTLDSIGISPRPWMETALWSFITLVLLVAAALASLFVIQAAGGAFGKSEPKIKLSLLTTSFVMLRASVAEEIFFRGYIFERWHTLLKNKWMAIALSLLPFALFHYQQGIWGIFMSFILGALLTVMYLWKRNLQANMIAHFLVDFIPNVLLPLMA